ncbi:MAG: hypothetical protein QOH51_1663 [Acidobacteriota bacterium]|jgi:hypothetical protein|nr:hypothetical protein [Acidobacteriota bacterium]
MQNPFQTNLRKPWLLLCTTVLVVYSISPGEHETLFYFNAPGSLLEALMFLLSFPLGDLLMFPFHSPAHAVMERFAFWAVAMGIGYAQWFHLFPALLRRTQTQTTTLNLSTCENVARPARTSLGLHSAETTPLSLGANEPTHALDDASRPPVPQFNERGLTPLERMFRDDEEA